MGNTSGSSNVTPSLYGDMKQRIAYYKNKDWALDPTINKNMWNAW